MSKSDPDQGVFNTVVAWHEDMSSLPTWDELIEVEFLRKYANINMFTDDVASYARQIGFTGAASWWERCFRLNKHPSTVWAEAVDRYQKLHGSQNTWITEKVLMSLRQKIAQKEADNVEIRS